MELNFNLEEFSGPLDLLLELIKKDEVDLYNIPIHQITSRYMEEMNRRAIPSGEIAEFIAMAAYLLEIKSQMLLPDHQLKSILEDEKDPRRLLVHRLLEYQKVKESLLFLEKKEAMPRRIYSDDLPLLLPKPAPASLDFEMDAVLLKEAMERLYQRRDSYHTEGVFYDEIRKENFSVMNQQREILQLLSYMDRATFSNLFEEAPRGQWVAGFLALLKLAQDQRVLLHQEATFSDIEIERRKHGKSS